MKRKDLIKLFGHAVLVEYGATGQTGSISVLRLDREVRFAIEGDAIRASYVSDPASALVERFASAELASNAYQHLQAVIKRYVFMRRVRNGAARLMLWGVAPFAVTILALSMNLAVTRGMEAHAAEPVAAATAALPVAGTAIVSARPSPAAPPAAEVAKAMQDGVKSGRYSISVSKGTKGTMYVFSDPACPYCKTLDPVLARLAKDYTIHIFPVSVVGGISSSNAVSGLMCRSSGQRAAAWKTLMIKRSTQDAPCRDGDDAINANDTMFNALRLHGTPAIVSGDGSVYPNVGETTDATILRWMNRQGR